MQCNCQESRCMTNKVTRRIWSMFKQIQVECTYLYLTFNAVVNQSKLSQMLFWKEQVNCIVYCYNLRVSRLLVGGKFNTALTRGVDEALWSLLPPLITFLNMKFLTGVAFTEMARSCAACWCGHQGRVGESSAPRGLRDFSRQSSQTWTETFYSKNSSRIIQNFANWGLGEERIGNW